MLAGRLAGDEVDALVRACRDITAGVTIDLSEVDYADDEGVKVLEDLRRRGATLHGARPYLKLLLDGEV